MLRAAPLGPPVVFLDTVPPTKTADRNVIGARPGFMWGLTGTGQWWVARSTEPGAAVWDPLTGNTFFVESFGAVGDGSTDDRAAIQAAIDACHAWGGGRVEFGPKRYRVSAPGLVLKLGVALIGDWDAPDEVQGTNYTTQGYAIILGTGATITAVWNNAIMRLAIFREGITYPTTLAECYAQVAAFAGTAITVTGTGLRLKELLILGFEYGIRWQTANAERIHIDRVNVDCLNPLDMDHCHDIAHIEHLHAWPFFTTHKSWASGNWSVTAIADNGLGKLRLTVPGHAVQTGWRVSIILDGFRRRGTATVIDANTLDFAEHAYSASYGLTGAKVFANSNYREGIGFRVRNSEAPMLIGCFSYGHEIGYDFDTGGGWVTCVACSQDNFNDAAVDDNIAIRVRGSSYGTMWFGGITSSCGTAVLIDSTSTSTHHFNGMKLHARQGGNFIEVVNGRATFTACSHGGAGNAVIRSGADAVGFGNCDFGTLTLVIEAAVGVVMSDTATRWGNRPKTRGSLGRLYLGGTPGEPTPLVIEGQSSDSDPNQGAQLAMRNTGGTDNWVYWRAEIDGSMQFLVHPYTAVARFDKLKRMRLHGETIFLGALGACGIYGGTGSPEGALTADAPSIYFRRDGAPGTLFYLKETGTGNTGWVAKW